MKHFLGKTVNSNSVKILLKYCLFLNFFIFLRKEI
jgi:hypothetical protein